MWNHAPQMYAAVNAGGKVWPTLSNRDVADLMMYFRSLPAELFEAAFVDGCSYIRFFWHISLPLSRPIVATVGIISFVGSWNSYILPLIMLNSEAKYPWPLGIMVYKGEFATDWQLVLAFITLTILPTIIVFFIAQRHIIAGLTAGAVKG